MIINANVSFLKKSLLSDILPVENICFEHDEEISYYIDKIYGRYIIALPSIVNKLLLKYGISYVFFGCGKENIIIYQKLYVSEHIDDSFEKIIRNSISMFELPDTVVIPSSDKKLISSLKLIM